MIRVLYLTPNRKNAEKAIDVLSQASGFAVVCPATFEELLTVLSSDSNTDRSTLVLIDLESPDAPCPNLVETLQLCFPSIPVVCAIEDDEPRLIAEASQKGAFGFVMVGNGYWANLPVVLSDFIRRFKSMPGSMGQRMTAEQHAPLVDELHAAYARSKALSQRLVKIREEESARIARELHDQLGQALTGLKLDVSWLQRRLARFAGTELVSEMLSRLEQMQKSIDGTIATTRKICSELRPGVLDDLGLVAAIEWQANEFRKRTNAEVSVQLPKSDLAFPPAITTAVFRIFQEILTNIARHANARHVEIRLEETSGVLSLEVKDDGCGFDESALPAAQSLGLLGMKERAQSCGGTLKIQSSPGHGTVIGLSVPLCAPPEA